MIKAILMSLFLMTSCGSPRAPLEKEHVSSQKPSYLFTHSIVDSENCDKGLAQIEVTEGEDTSKEEVCIEDDASGSFAASSQLKYHVDQATADECATGGLALTIWFDENADEKLEIGKDSQLARIPSCRGEKGDQGVGAGVRTERVEKHEECAAGAVVIESWNDHNNNKKFDDSIDDGFMSRVVCDGEDLINTWDGVFRSADETLKIHGRSYVNSLFSKKTQSLIELGQFMSFERDEFNFVVFEPKYYECQKDGDAVALSLAQAKKISFLQSEPLLKTEYDQIDAQAGIVQNKEKSLALNKRKITGVKNELTWQAKTLAQLKEKSKQFKADHKATAATLAIKSSEFDNMSKLQRSLKQQLQNHSQALIASQRESAADSSQIKKAKEGLEVASAKLRRKQNELKQQKAMIDRTRSEIQKTSSESVKLSRKILAIKKAIESGDKTYFSKRRSKKELANLEEKLLELTPKLNVAAADLLKMEESHSLALAPLGKLIRQHRSAEEVVATSVKKLEMTSHKMAQLDKAFQRSNTDYKKLSLDLKDLGRVITSISGSKLSLEKSLKSNSEAQSESESRIKKLNSELKSLENTKLALEKSILSAKEKIAKHRKEVDRISAARLSFGATRKYFYKRTDSSLTLDRMNDSSKSISYTNGEPVKVSPVNCSELFVSFLNR